MFDKIVLASDGSEGAAMAARMAGEIARAFHSELHVVCCWYPPPIFADYSPFPGAYIDPGSLDSLRESFHDTAWQRAVDGAGELGKPPVAHTVVGSAGMEVCRVAEEAGAGLIVAGSRGLGGFSRMLLGSVSDAVVHHAPCSVLIVHAVRLPIRRVLVAADGSCHSVRAAQVAAALAGPSGAALEVVQVFEGLHGDPPLPEEWTGWDAQSTREMEVVQHAVNPVLAESGVPAEYVQRTGHPVDMILREAEEMACDILVVGSRGMGGFKSMLLGSVSDGVVRHAACPVLVAR